MVKWKDMKRYIGNKLLPIERELRKIRKDINFIVGEFDKVDMDHEKRIARLESFH